MRVLVHDDHADTKLTALPQHPVDQGLVASLFLTVEEVVGLLDNNDELQLLPGRLLHPLVEEPEEKEGDQKLLGVEVETIELEDGAALRERRDHRGLVGGPF